MKFGLPISLALHGGVLAVSVLGFGFKAKAAPIPQIIPVKILTISDETNVRAAIKAPKPTIVEAPAAKPDISEPVDVPEPKPEKQAASVAEQPDIQPPKPKPAPPKPLSLDDLSALVKSSKGKTESGTQKMLEGERARIDLAEADRAAAGAGTVLTTAYEDAIMRRIYNAWRIPSGAPDLESLVVGVDVTLDRDGSVLTANLNSDSRRRAAGDDYYKIAAESAVRAVQDAAGFKFLPRSEYERWRELSLIFFPKDAPAGSAGSSVPT